MKKGQLTVIDRDSHRMTKAFIYTPSQEVSSHVFRQSVVIQIGQLFPIYVSVIMFYNELTWHLLYNFYGTFNLVNGHHSPLSFPLPIDSSLLF